MSAKNKNHMNEVLSCFLPAQTQLRPSSEFPVWWWHEQNISWRYCGVFTML